MTLDVCLFQETWWAFFLLSLPVVELFYVPGVAPRNFHDGDVVDIKVQLEESFHMFQLSLLLNCHSVLLLFFFLMLLPSLVPDHHHCPSCSLWVIGFLCTIAVPSAFIQLCCSAVTVYQHTFKMSRVKLPHCGLPLHSSFIGPALLPSLQQCCGSAPLLLLFLLFARSVNHLHFTTHTMTYKVLES